jgi:hypothetical protein
MDMRIIGVPVVDGDPIEPGAEIAFGIGHQLTREGPQAFELGRILGRHDEPEMVAIIPATSGKRLLVGDIRAGIEHGGVHPIMSNAVALQIEDMLRQRRRMEPGAAVTHHTGLRHYPTRAGRTRQ